MKYILFLIVIAYSVSSCGSSDHDHDHDHSHHDHDHDHNHGGESHSADGIHYGKVISTDSTMSLAELVAALQVEGNTFSLDLGDEMIVQAITSKLEGEVVDVCKKAGCWLTMQTVEGDEIRIMTNHDFFVDQDIVGKNVVAYGDAYESITSVDELRHYAEDEGLPAEEIAKITEPKSEISMIAEGVAIKQ